MAHQDYFTHSGVKMGDPLKKPPDHPQKELDWSVQFVFVTVVHKSINDFAVLCLLWVEKQCY